MRRVGQERSTANVECGIAASTRIVSFTVTEAGYYLGSDDHLDRSHADLHADLSARTQDKKR